MTTRCAVLIVLLLLALGFVSRTASASGHCGNPADVPIHFLVCSWKDTTARQDRLEAENRALRDRVALLEAQPRAGPSRDQVWQTSKDACWALLHETGLLK